VPPKLKVSANILEGMNFPQGEPMRIRIPILGRPLPHVIWSKDGEIIESSEKYQMYTEGDNAVLMIIKSGKEDGGLYGLEVRNQFGSDQVSFNVRILGKY